MLLKTQAKLEELREFVRGVDRDRTPIFAGRENEIAGIVESLRVRANKWSRREKGAWKSATRLIQGAPGAGKTAILDRLEEILPAEFGDIDLQVCRLMPKELSNPSAWESKLGAALAPKLWEDANKERTRKTGGGLKAWIFSTRMERSSRRTRSNAWTDFAAAIRKQPRKARPVLLLIDEVQRVADNQETRGFLGDLIHDAGDDLPIFPVYGGLAFSEERLDQLGVSRLSDPAVGPANVATLDPLPESEARAVCERFFEYFEISGSEALKERWTAEVVRESRGWPHHIHTHLQAFGDALLRDEADRDLDALERGGGEAFARIEELARGARDRHYGRRLTRRALREQGGLAAEAALRVGPGRDTIARLGREIERIADASEDPETELPQGMTGKGFAEAMVRAGILHKNFVTRAIRVPIPSFLDYLREQGFGKTAPEADAENDSAPNAGM